MFTRIRNAQATARATVRMPASKVKLAIAKVLKDEGYIRDVQVSRAENNKAVLEIALKYFEGRPAIEKLDRVSRSGLRVYRGKDELPKVMGGLGIAIISTPAGIMTEVQARAKGVGGEVLGTVA
jgi:small subunit ribosomal protein S8